MIWAFRISFEAVTLTITPQNTSAVKEYLALRGVNPIVK